MTINEYLGLASKLRSYITQCEKEYNKAFSEATSVPGMLGREGIRSGNRSGLNVIEQKLIKQADAARELNKARMAYSEYREQLQADINNLYYWEGILIEQMYINNPILGEDTFYRVNEILKTDSPAKIRRKTNEAKAHLAEIMRARGADIDNSN